MKIHAERTQAASGRTASASVRSLFKHPLLDGPSRRLVIRASAGTGKTFQLVNRYLAVLRFSNPEKILATTFTRKAAGEILERVLLRLAEAAEDDQKLKLLGEQLNGPPLDRAECLQLLTRLTRNLHRVRIGTLDSFFVRIAGCYSLELGFPPGWSIADDVEIDELRDMAIDSILREGDIQDTVQLMHLLDKGQSSRSIAGLVRETVADLYELSLDTSPESWECIPDLQFPSPERREEVLAAIEAVEIAQKKMADARDKDCASFRDGSWEDRLKGKSGLMVKLVEGETTFNRVPFPEPLLHGYSSLLEQVRAMVAVPWRHQNLAARDLLLKFHEKLESMKLNSGRLGFSDLPRKILAARRSTELRHLSYRLDGEIEHLLVDEFQDTSPVQWNVLRPLAEVACNDPSRSFFCVGDVKQAIYGWRGGEAAIFEAIERHLPGLSREPLNLSYRSSPVVIEFVNEVMSRVSRHDNLEQYRGVLESWVSSFPRHETTQRTLPGFVRILSGPEAEDGKFLRGELKDVAWPFLARYIADRLSEHPAGTVGVLTRSNAPVGRLIYELNQLGIEASEEVGNPLTDSAAVQLVLSLLTFADHPGHTIARHHVARSPLGRLLEFEDDTDDAAAHAVALTLRRRILDEGYAGMIHDLIPGLAQQCNPRELRRLLQLAELAAAYDEIPHGLRAQDFVEFVERQKLKEPRTARVRVMNIHQSKGLEFDTVILAELDVLLTQTPDYVTSSPVPGDPPELVALHRSEKYFQLLGGSLAEARQQTLDRQFHESLCLLYVALTRARHSVHLMMLPCKGKDQPKTFAGLIRGALELPAAVAPESELFRQGEPEWFRHLPAKTAEVDPVEIPVPQVRFAESRRNRRLPRLAPSRRKQAASRLGDLLSTRTSEALPRGVLFHHWLESIDWIDRHPPVVENLLAAARGLHLEPGAVRRHLDRFLEEIAQPAVSAVLSSQMAGDWSLVKQGVIDPNLQFEIRRELAFAHAQEGGLASGAIDRLVVAIDQGKVVGADVVDFKSDVIEGNEGLDRKMKVYTPQLQSYSRAVQRLFGLPPERVSSRLVFLSPGTVRIVPPAE